MIKTKFVFAVSLVAMMAVSSAMAAATAVTTTAPTSGNGQAISGTTGTVGTVYDWSKWTGYQTNGIAGVTYVNKAVDAAGNAAQWAENHAAAAGTAAKSAAESAAAAAQSATNANNALGSKQDILVPNTNIKGSGSVTVTKGTDGVITVSGTDNDTKYTLPNATASTLGGVKVGTNISVSSGTISVANAGPSTSGVAKLYAGTGTATDGSMTQKAVTDIFATKEDMADGLDAKQAVLVPNTNIKGSGSVTVTKGTDGVITVSGTDNDTKYTLPNATASTLGGVKVGTNISVSSGTISVANAGPSTSGVAKLYAGTGTATDGSMTQKAVTEYVAAQVTSVSEGTANQLSVLGQEISDLDDNKVDIAQGSAAANKAVITNGSGSITTGTIATDMIASGAVTVAKTTGLYGVIPAESQGNTAKTANIWVE